MKNKILEKNILFVLKIILFMFFWYFIIPYLLYKKFFSKYFKNRKEKIKLKKLQELDRFREQQKDYTSPYWISVMGIIRNSKNK